MISVLQKTAKDLMVNDFFRIDANNSLASFIGKIKSWREEEALVFDKGNYIGVVSFKGLLRKRVSVSDLKIKSVTTSFPKLSEEDSLLKIAELMYYSGARLLPVMRNEKVLGVVYCNAVIDLIKELPALRKFKACDIASKDLIFLDVNDPIEKAIDLMKEKRVRKIPVMEKKKFAGVLFLERVLRKYYLHDTLKGNLFRQVSSLDHTIEKNTILKTPVVNELETNIISCSPTESVVNIVKNFDPEYGIFVIENSLPSGVITAKNLLKLFFEFVEQPRNIRLINMPALDEIDKARINTLITTSYDKIKKIVGKVFMLSVHFKEYEKTGMRRKHVVTFRLTIGGKSFKIEKWNWNLTTAVQQCAKATITDIKRTFNKRR